MSRVLVDGVWVIQCDFVDENGNPCSFGVDGQPAMFVDPTGGQDPNTHFQCGAHHGVVKQSDKPEFQVPEDHKLAETSLVNPNHKSAAKKVELEGFRPDPAGRVWDGSSKPKVR